MREKEFSQELNEISTHIPPKLYRILSSFLDAYKQAVPCFEETLSTLFLFLEFVKEAVRSPHNFSSYHKKITHPFNYYQFGIDFVKPLIDLSKSRILGISHLEEIRCFLQNKENVVLFSNHQTEIDPPVIATLLEKEHPDIGESIIYVAGERVTTDPLAIPFSMGCDLLCIYSKRYIDHPPELKAAKQLHNKKTMQRMSELLAEGGKIIYVAPSGGRDRKNNQGIVEIAPFDPDSIEMFHLMARKSKTPTHFIPFTLSTYNLLPPPATIQHELGEMRPLSRTAVHIAFASPFNMDHFPGSEAADKIKRRESKAKAIWDIVNKTYQQLEKL